MQPGEIVADRFVVERLAGRGGMGSVYRALDRLSGEPVALKVVDAGSVLFEERFFREARALAAISHPAVVRYVAQGAMPRYLWLAMEWLEGEDLSERLARGRLDLREGVALVTRAAEAIAAAHAAGVVHRDLKPSNLFLPGRDPAALKVLDFGVARVHQGAKPLTKTGQMVGTVGFMAPEQISGDRDLDHRADIFALGCVAFEAFTGRPAFPGATLIAIIAKVLKDDPPKPSDLDPRIPPALDALVLSMLEKQRASRPSTAAEVARTLSGVGATLGGEGGVAVPAARSSVTGREQRLVSIILVAPNDPGGAARVSAVARKVGESCRADVLELGEGAHLMVVGGAGTAKDQAARACACALSLRAELSDVRIAVGTGLAEPTGGLPVGPAIDRAAALIETRLGDRIPIDDVTAALLDDRFEVVVEEGAHALAGKGRALAGAPPAATRTPFVGRDKEMAMIDAVLAECFEEPVARSVLVMGPPGAGKSRLRREFLARALGRESGAGDSPRAVFARADVVGSGSALGLARQILERLAGIADGEAREAKAAALSRFADAIETEPAARARVREFAAELLGVSSVEPASVELSSARNEPRVLAEWLRRTFAHAVAAVARRGPLVVVLEDLHWGDEASVEFVAEAMAQSEALPLFVLALARPEVMDALPRLREVLAPQEVRLGGLTPRASQKLAEAALGKAATPEVVARIVARSEGNPFFLEELARSEADGHADASETVLAVVQSRIQRLEPEARRLLRAASVFGRVFQIAGVARLLGMPDIEDEHGAPTRRGPAALAALGPAPSQALGDLLAYLDERELVEKARSQDVRSDAGWAFRHDLLRDAAYATLPENDRARAHLLAAEWLRESGEADSGVLAEHYERAGDKGRAVEYLARAIEEAQNAASYERVIALAKRGVEAGASGRVLGTMRAAEGLARAWRHDWRGAHAVSSEALALLDRGSTSWFRAASVHTFAALSTGDAAGIGELTTTILELAKTAEPTGPYGFAVFALMLVLGLAGRRQAAEALLAELGAREGGPLVDFGFVTWSALAHGYAELLFQGNPGRSFKHLEIAERFAPGLADNVVRVVLAYFRATLYYDCGDFEAAVMHAKSVIDAKGADAVPYLRSWSEHVIGRVRLVTGRLDEALAIATSLAHSVDALFTQRARSLEAQVLLAMGRLDEAAAKAETVIRGAPAPQDIAVAHATLARVHLAKNEPAPALAAATRAYELVKDGCTPTSESLVRNAYIEALLAAGEPARAKEEAARALARIDAIARAIKDARLSALWRAFPENAKTTAHAAAA